jgi:succinate-semialdehyde dehydrogenase/glutarate-semialdehyde dehydrogenase
MVNDFVTLPLKDRDLLRQEMLVDGAWIQADNDQVLEVRNPATGALVARVPNGGAAETRRAIAAAEKAMQGWRATLSKERSKILRRLYDLMLAHIDDLAVIMTAEQGKPLSESRGEIVYAAGFIEWFAEEAKRVYGRSFRRMWMAGASWCRSCRSVYSPLSHPGISPPR